MSQSVKQQAVGYINGVKDHIISQNGALGYTVVSSSEKEGMFTVEDAEGYRAYLHICAEPSEGVAVIMKCKGMGIQFETKVPYDVWCIMVSLAKALREARKYEKDTTKIERGN